MITIATVTYNAADTLERTLLSVESQHTDAIQHIIMDGGSKDATVSIAQAYRQRVAGRYEVVVVSERDKGLYDAMNKVLQRATGDYVCFLNAGDKLHSPDTLSAVIQHADVTSVGVIYGDTDIVDAEGQRLRARRLSPPECLTWRSFKNGMLVCHQSFYVNRLIAQQYDLAYRFSADIDWCIRCMKEGERMDMANSAVRQSDGSIAVLTDYLSEGMTTANHRASLLERFRIMATHYGTLTAIMQHLWFVVRAVAVK